MEASPVRRGFAPLECALQAPASLERFDPATMALRGRIGAYRLHATHDPRETTKAARAKFLARFVDEVDPERSLPEAERLRRAESAKRAYFSRLALKSARTRARKKKASRGATLEARRSEVGDAAQSAATS